MTYANSFNNQSQYCSSYVWGKFIDYNADAINMLLELRPSGLCGVQNINDHNDRPNNEGVKL